VIILKKILITLFVLLSLTFVFSSEQMKMDLLQHWINNGIIYQKTNNGLIADVVDSGRIKIAVMKDYDFITLVFSYDVTENDFSQMQSSPVLPYSRKFRIDLLDSLIKKLNYFINFNQHPDSIWEYLDNVYVKTSSYADELFFYYSFY
jgi:hypothetical protein